MDEGTHIVMDDSSWEDSFIDFDSLPDLPAELQEKLDELIDGK